MINDAGKLIGLISNADVRKAMLKNLEDLNKILPNDMINTTPVTLQNDAKVVEMLQLIKKSKFPITYLPIVRKDGNAQGIITFVNLIKGEL